MPPTGLSERGGILLESRELAHFVDFGTGAYGDILRLQESIRGGRQQDRLPDSWLFGEHPAVITQGVRGDPKDIPGAAFPEFKLPIVQVDRGGMTTLHSDGQMILYAIVKLKGGSLSAGKLARALLESMNAWLTSKHGVTAEMPKGRLGLFVDERKLMSVGISVRDGVSMHGVAMNLSNDLSLWDHIVACGEARTRPISLSELKGESLTPASQRSSIRQWIQTDLGYDEIVDRSPFEKTNAFP